MTKASKKILHIILMLVTIISPVSSFAVVSNTGSEIHHTMSAQPEITTPKQEHNSCHEMAGISDLSDESNSKKECCEDHCFCAQMGCHLTYLSFESINVSLSRAMILSDYLNHAYLNPSKNILSPPPIA